MRVEVAASQGGWTALLWAAMRGHADVAELLLRRGAALADEDGVRLALSGANACVWRQWPHR